MERDFEIKMDYSRNRYNDYVNGRFISADMNGQGLGASGRLSKNGQTITTFAPFKAYAQYRDGHSLYQSVRSNPFKSIDPSGLYQEDIHFYMTYYIAVAMGLDKIPTGYYRANCQYILDFSVR